MDTLHKTSPYHPFGLKYIQGINHGNHKNQKNHSSDNWLFQVSDCSEKPAVEALRNEDL